MNTETKTDHTDEVITRIIKRADGGVLVRIGSKMETPSPTVVESAHVNEVDNVEASRREQIAKNAAYRQSTTRQYIEDNNNNDTNNNNIAGDSIDSGHMLYRRVSSSKQKTGSPTSRTKSFITRKLTKGRLSTKTSDGANVDEALPNGDETDSANIQVDNLDYFDALARKKLDYRDDGSLKNFPKDACFCCRKTVYQKEKIGPIRGVLFHKQCFRCCVCGFVLNLTNFHHNSNDLEDRGLYCKSHEPIAKSASLKIKDKTIQAGINKPKVEQLNPNIRVGQEVKKVQSLQTEGVSIQNHPKVDTNNINTPNHSSQEGRDSWTTQQPTVQHTTKVTVDDKSSKAGPNTTAVMINTEASLAPQNGNAYDLYPVSLKTAINAPKIPLHNTTVRPVPAMARTAPVPGVYISPVEYITRQIPGPAFSQTPSPPSSPQHVHFNGNTKTYYYISKM